ncbi:MAG: peptidoglycan-binding protein [Steroidobacteraceae bacterium]|nr:peptidoglycan-binding protein [Steroidobacteraceae bacterium]
MAASASDIFELALEHVGEPYVLGSRARWATRSGEACGMRRVRVVVPVPGDRRVVRSEAAQRSRRADAFTDFWFDQAHAANAVIPVEVAARTVGAFVVRKPMPGKIGHIVISDGKGGTIEAHSSETGVIRSTFVRPALRVRMFQESQGLVADGEVGPATLKSLKIAVPAFAKKTVAL